MANGGRGGFGPRGEIETTQHGTVNDVTVPKLQLGEIILMDYKRITLAMLAVPVLATLLYDWTFPIVGATIVFLLAWTNVQDELNDSNADAQSILGLLAKILGIATLVFGALALSKGKIVYRLEQGLDALWQWPPMIGYFLNRVLFLTLPFFIPPFARYPLLIERFKNAIRDPSWPSPRSQRDVEGLQNPYADGQQEEIEPRLWRGILGKKRYNGQSEKELIIPDTAQWARFITYVLDHLDEFSETTARKYNVPITVKNWQQRGKEPGFREVRDILFERGYARWTDPDHHRQGITIEDEGIEQFEGFVSGCSK